MEIRCIGHRSAEGLEAFYATLSTAGAPEDGFSQQSERMLELIRHLREMDGPTVWAVTSLHAGFALRAGEDHALPDLVRVHVGEWYSLDPDRAWFSIECRMAPEDTPWPDAYVVGRTPDVVQAGQMILTGLRNYGYFAGGLSGA